MPDDQVPSDAEVARIVSTAARTMAYGGAGPSDIERMSNAFSSLLRERQAVPARIVAAVMAEREACAATVVAMGPLPAEMTPMGRHIRDRTAKAISNRPSYCGTDHLAAQLAAAFDDCANALLDDGSHKNIDSANDTTDTIMSVLMRRFGVSRQQWSAARKLRLSTVPTPPAGGADDAG